MIEDLIVQAVVLEDLAETRELVDLAVAREERPSQLRQLDRLVLGDAHPLELVVAQVLECALLTLVVDAKVLAELVVHLELDHVIRVQVPRIDRVLPVVVDRDRRHELGNRVGDDAAHDRHLVQHIAAVPEPVVTLVCLQEATERRDCLRAVQETRLGDLVVAVVGCRFSAKSDAVVVERESGGIVFPVEHDPLESLVDGRGSRPRPRQGPHECFVRRSAGPSRDTLRAGLTSGMKPNVMLSPFGPARVTTSSRWMG